MSPLFCQPPTDCWDRLLLAYDQLVRDLEDVLHSQPGLVSNEMNVLADLLVAAQAYSELVKQADRRVYLRDWELFAAARLRELKADSETKG